MSPIDAYVRSLSRAVGGRRTVIVAEARDHLYDAADAWQARGLDRVAAERRAVEEFGAVDDLAPAYRSVVALATVRRSVVLMLLTVGIQPLVWTLHESAAVQGHATDGLDLASVIIGWTAIAAAVAGLLLCSVGVRRLGVRAWMVRSVSALASLVAVSTIALGVGWMTIAEGTVSGFVLSAVVLDAPMLLVLALSASSWRHTRGHAVLAER